MVTEYLNNSDSKLDEIMKEHEVKNNSLSINAVHFFSHITCRLHRVQEWKTMLQKRNKLRFHSALDKHYDMY